MSLRPATVRLAAPVTLIVLLLLMTGCARLTQAARPSQSAPVTSPSSVAATGTVVLVSLAESGRRGDLPALVAQHPGLDRALASSLATLATGESQGLDGPYTVVSLEVAGAERAQSEVRLYAWQLMETFAIQGGRLLENGGSSAPVRIRLSAGDLRPLGIDTPGDGSDYGPSLDRMMPGWAQQAVGDQCSDAAVQSVRDAAGRLALRSGRLGKLVDLPRPSHPDPLREPIDVYSLRAIPPELNGFSLRPVSQPRSSDLTPGQDDLEKMTRSKDGRFDCFYILRAWDGLLVLDHKTNEWLHLDGPGFGIGIIEPFGWAGDVLAFDIVDVGFSEPRPKVMTRVRVEVDLARRVVDRVVPIGPYTGNWRQDR